MAQTKMQVGFIESLTASLAELNILDGVTSNATELNLLDNVSGLVQADLTKLAEITVTSAEVNLVDGGTARGTTAVASGDGILINDAGTMRMTNVDTVSTYFSAHNVGGGNLVTVGTIGTGVWNGTAIITTYGGTGLASYTAGDMFYYASGTTLTKLARGTADQVLTMNDGATAPGWETAAAGGDFSNGGDNGALVLGTNDSNSLTLETTNTARMVIAAAGDVTVSTGNIVIGTSGKGIDFSAQASPASGMSAEVLDRYEEGTWTPAIFDNTNGVRTGSYDYQYGSYVRIGRQVFFSGRFLLNSMGNLYTAHTAQIVGLPFTSSSTTNSDSAIFIGYGAQLNIDTAQDTPTGFLGSENTQINLYIWDRTDGTIGMRIVELSDNGLLMFSGFYFVD